MGTAYSLPVGLVDFRLTVKPDTAVFSLSVDDPVYVADPDHNYVLRYQWSVISDDTWTVNVDKKGLLGAIEVTTEDRLDEIILEAVKSFVGVLEHASLDTAAKETILVQMPIDPSDERQVDALQRLMNEKVLSYSREYIRHRCSSGNSEACTAYKESVRESLHGAFVSLRVGKPAPVELNHKPNCGEGVCYRSVKPHVIRFSIGKGTSFTKVVSLPNSSPVISLNFSRALFVKKITNVTFEEGILTKIHVEKPSEALELAKLPLAIAKAIISVPTEIIQLRINQDAQRVKEIEGRTKLLEARQKAEQERAELESSQLQGKSVIKGSSVSMVPPPPRPPVLPGNGNSPVEGTGSGQAPGGTVIGTGAGGSNQ